MEKTSQIFMRGIYWLAFFGFILLSWVWLYAMSLSMNMDFFGRMHMPTSSMSMDPMEISKENSPSMPRMQNDSEAFEKLNSMKMPDYDTEMSGADKMVNMPSGSGKISDMSEDIGQMGDMSHGSGMLIDRPMMGFGALFGMWAVMMAAMMLPTMVPTLKSYEDLMQSADGTRAGWVGVLIGYGIAWIAFAAIITVAQMGLLHRNLVDMMGLATSVWLSATLLITAGAFQFTRAKEICHGVCHSPMTYFLGHWKRGFRGGLWMGLGLGAFCVGCCWLFMVLGFAGGIMNFLWMGLATLFMVLEKLPDIGHRVVRPMGLLLIIAGLALAVWSYHTMGVV